MGCQGVPCTFCGYRYSSNKFDGVVQIYNFYIYIHSKVTKYIFKLHYFIKLLYNYTILMERYLEEQKAMITPNYMPPQGMSAIEITKVILLYIQSKKLQYRLLSYTTYKILYPTTNAITFVAKNCVHLRQHKARNMNIALHVTT